LLRGPGKYYYHSKESTQGVIATPVWPARHDLGVVDYKAITIMSIMWVPHFRARRGASLKILNPDTMCTSKTKCFLFNRRNTRKHTNVSKSLKLRIARVIY
jgi:hypothetical protein